MMPVARTKRRLPTGLQSFPMLRERGCCYVDKTHFACQLLRHGRRYSLSRPRRFGKSLFVSTLKALFEGRRDLFQGLAAYEQWDWSVRRPVVRLSFGGGHYTQPDGLHHDVLTQLDLNLLAQLHLHEFVSDITLSAVRGADRLFELLFKLHYKSGRRVVVLVDECDKPITDNLNQPDLARANRDYLGAVYSALKGCDEHIYFSFLTAVTRFSKASLFSSLDNSYDLTFDPRYSSLCGYTERDLDEVFAPELEGLDREEIRHWYNGYSWGGDERVYNPHDLLLTFRNRKCKAWWFQTGTPSLLPDLLVRRNLSTLDLEGRTADQMLLSDFDIHHVATEALLFQTGYLTITEVLRGQYGGRAYRTGYPNREVRVSLNRVLLSGLVNSFSERRLAHCRDVAKHIRAADFEQLHQALHAFFASIPHDWYRNHRIERYEGYYATVFFTVLSGFGLDTRREEAAPRGNLNLAVSAPERIVLFEFNTVLGHQSSGRALRQLKAKGYAHKYLGSGKPVHLVGVEFSQETRNVARVEWETVGTAEAGSADASAATAQD